MEVTVNETALQLNASGEFDDATAERAVRIVYGTLRKATVVRPSTGQAYRVTLCGTRPLTGAELDELGLL